MMTSLIYRHRLVWYGYMISYLSFIAARAPVCLRKQRSCSSLPNYSICNGIWNENCTCVVCRITTSRRRIIIKYHLRVVSRGDTSSRKGTGLRNLLCKGHIHSKQNIMYSRDILHCTSTAATINKGCTNIQNQLPYE